MASRYPNRSLSWPILWAGVELIAESEECVLKSYLCPAGVWTLGWGATSNIGPRMTWTQDQADEDLLMRLNILVGRIIPMCRVKPDEHELAAFCSLADNIGLLGFSKSTVLRLHNAGDKAGAARAFKLWNKATVNGKLVVMDGLVTRRSREAALYIQVDEHAHSEPMPHAVAPESKLTESPIMRSGIATATAGGVAVISQVGDDAGKWSDRFAAVAQNFGVSPIVLLGIGLVVAGCVVMYWRHKQRQEGWA